jgi:hypothetical protein
MTTRLSTPSSNSIVAAVCRPSWTRASRTPASARISFQSFQSCRASMGRPFGWHHGGFDGPSFYRPRVITVGGVASSPNRATNLRARDIIASICADPAVRYPLVVTEPGRPTRRCMVRLSSAAKARDVTDTIMAWSLIFVAPDPRRYDDTETVVTLGLPPTGGSGATLPFTLPFAISSAGSSSSQATVINQGTLATLPLVTFTGPLINPTIANVTAGRTLAFNITLSDGQQLVVDFASRSVLLDGLVSRSYAIAPGAAWWDIPPGSSDLKFTGDGGSGSAGGRVRSAWA